MSITGPSSYYPGKTYTITTALTGGSIYGFEITAVQASNTSTVQVVFLELDLIQQLPAADLMPDIAHLLAPVATE